MADLDALVAGYHDALDGIEALAGELDAADWELATGCPGWSVRDQVAHVVGLESLLAGAPFPDHEVPADLPHVRDEVGRFMEVTVDIRRGEPIADLLAEVRAVFPRRRAWLDGLEDLEQQVPSFFGGQQPLYRWLPVRVLDLYAHEQDIRRATDRRGHEDGPAAAVTADRIRRGLLHVLPDRLGRAGTVVLDVEGAHGGTVAVDLAGGRLERPPEEPTVRLRLSFADYVAVGCGRSDAPDVGDLDVEGDRGLATDVLAAAALTP